MLNFNTFVCKGNDKFREHETSIYISFYFRMKFHPEEFAPVPASALSCLQGCVLGYAIYCPVRFLPLAATKEGYYALISKIYDNALIIINIIDYLVLYSNMIVTK